ncbi:PhzF family phenazine biosynthesis protein [Legionella tunisiensis]|uniref:PhzF family phenazine biosynthesis protein n=1 Tax=Legionella tunisiensis TaxID=1034944 RepID=UPI0002FE852D|nr:PhzF family phenazine biosynthesis protein [Legionella tunisiensis]
MDFPRLNFQLSETPELISVLIDKPYVDVFESDLDYLILLADEDKVLHAQVDLKALVKLPKRGLILTSQCSDADFYSRCFYPRHNIAEDPVTGSAHCVLGPFWAERLNKKSCMLSRALFAQGR